MRILSLLLAGFLLTACGSTPPNPPDSWLLAPAKTFPKPTAEANARVQLAEAAASHNHNVRKIRGLQRYVKIVLRKE